MLEQSSDPSSPDCPKVLHQENRLLTGVLSFLKDTWAFLISFNSLRIHAEYTLRIHAFKLFDIEVCSGYVCMY